MNDTFISEHEKARRWQHYQQSRNQPPGRNPRNRASGYGGRRGQQAGSPELTPPQAEGPGGMDREALEMINEYFYGVRVFPGQVCIYYILILCKGHVNMTSALKRGN